jgi:hypothetical protein
MKSAPCLVSALVALLCAAPLQAQLGPTQAPQQSRAIQILDIDDSVRETQNYFELAAPRKVFHFVIPPGGTITVAIEHPKRSLLQLAKATLAELQGTRQSGWEKRFPINGKLSHTNPDKTPLEMFFMVTDPTEVSSAKEPYKVMITRTWVPEKK